MRVKTSELSGAMLDWVVAKCEGTTIRDNQGLGVCIADYSSDWSLAGPIIEKENIHLSGPTVFYLDVGREQQEFNVKDWRARIYLSNKTAQSITQQRGETSLIAAMRCYVASKLGDSVEVPEDVLKLLSNS